MLKVKMDGDDFPRWCYEQDGRANSPSNSRTAMAKRTGYRLPSGQGHLAAVMGVNTNTALRALRVLHDEIMLELH